MNPFNIIGPKPAHERLTGRGAEFVRSIHMRLGVLDAAVQRVRNEAFMNNGYQNQQPEPVPATSQQYYAAAQPQQQPMERPQTTTDFQGTVAPAMPDNRLAGVKHFTPAPYQTVEQPVLAPAETPQPGPISESEALAKVFQVHDESLTSQQGRAGI